MTTPNQTSNNEIIVITPDQREALRQCASYNEFSSRYPDFCSSLRKIFDEDGVVVIRGLLDEDNLLERLDQDALDMMLQQPNAYSSQRFTSIKFGPIFSSSFSAFRDVALFSTIPRFVGLVLLAKDDDDNNASLRVLKDAFLAKSDEAQCCGWHVDDAGFWPTNAKSNPGVNAWIAIDDIPPKYGGGLAVSPSSHNQEASSSSSPPWQQEAYEAIGATPLYPEEGLVPGTPFFERMMKGKDGRLVGKTCSMEDNNPEMAKKLDDSRRVYDFQKGDVLFHTRWLFHRSMPLTTEGKKHYQQQERQGVDKNTIDKSKALRRYSIRYEHGDSKLLKGVNKEHCVLLNSDNAGKTLDDVSKTYGPFYPQCWPQVPDEELNNMDRLVAEKFPEAEAKGKNFFQAMMMKQQHASSSAYGA